MQRHIGDPAPRLRRNQRDWGKRIYQLEQLERFERERSDIIS